MVSEELEVLRTVIAICLLVLLGRVLGSIFSRFRLPEVIGEVSAGIILGPLALGGLIVIFDEPLVKLTDLMLAFASIGGIIILFSAGLEFTIHDLRKAGAQAALVGTSGVIVPLFSAYAISLLFGYDWTVSILIGATMTATSIAVTVRVLEELNKHKSVEGNIMVNAAMIDDVLGLTVLSVATSVVLAGAIPSIFDIASVTIRSVIIWLVLLMASVFLLPRLIKHITCLRAKGATEVVSIGSAFGVAAAAGGSGLSPIIGAFAAGMGLASSESKEEIHEFVEKLKILFGPLFFAIIGTYIDPSRMLDVDVIFFLALAAIAILSKILGCGIPAALMMKNMSKGLKVGYGMVSRGEVGFIIAGIGLAHGIFNQSIYSELVLIIMVTTVISPILLKHAYSKEASAGAPVGVSAES